MKVRKAFTAQQSMRRAFLALLALAIPTGFFTGCGASSPAPTGTTNVMVLMTSTANDQLIGFTLTIASIALADSAGKSAVLYNNPNAVGLTASGPGEWMHLNGVSEPLATVSVPQGTYTSATLTAGECSVGLLKVTEESGESVIGPSIYEQGTCAPGTGVAAVNLPSPITVSGPDMVLSLNLQVFQSYTLTGSSPNASLTMTPVFTLTPVAISSPPTNQRNGKMGPMFSLISSINSTGNSFVAQTANGVTINVTCDDSTTYQGIEGFTSLTSGMIVDMDLAIQPDLSLLATRVEAPDPAAPVAFAGPLDYGPFPSPQDWFGGMWTNTLGCNNAGPMPCDSMLLYNPSTTFGVSGEYNNLQDPPFAASLTVSSLFLGQNLYVFSPGNPNSQGVETATTVTLAPQTINGTVGAIASNNGFGVYTVTLAPYDPIPAAQQWACSGCYNPLTNPNTVLVYADANTQLLNSTPIDPGSVLRFTGLIFDDNGTLRMDCGQILDGVPE